MSILSQTAKKLYTAYNVASTNFVYNATGNTGASKGWKTARYNFVGLAYACGTMAATTLHIRVEGRDENTYDRTIKVYSATIDSTTTIDTYVRVSPQRGRFRELRLGVKANNNATPTNSFHAAFLFTELL